MNHNRQDSAKKTTKIFYTNRCNSNGTSVSFPNNEMFKRPTYTTSNDNSKKRRAEQQNDNDVFMDTPLLRKRRHSYMTPMNKKSSENASPPPGPVSVMPSSTPRSDADDFQNTNNRNNKKPGISVRAKNIRSYNHDSLSYSTNRSSSFSRQLSKPSTSQSLSSTPPERAHETVNQPKHLPPPHKKGVMVDFDLDDSDSYGPFDLTHESLKHSEMKQQNSRPLHQQKHNDNGKDLFDMTRNSNDRIISVSTTRTPKLTLPKRAFHLQKKDNGKGGDLHSRPLSIYERRRLSSAAMHASHRQQTNNGIGDEIENMTHGSGIEKDDLFTLYGTPNDTVATVSSKAQQPRPPLPPPSLSQSFSKAVTSSNGRLWKHDPSSNGHRSPATNYITSYLDPKPKCDMDELVLPKKQPIHKTCSKDGVGFAATDNSDISTSNGTQRSHIGLATSNKEELTMDGDHRLLEQKRLISIGYDKRNVLSTKKKNILILPEKQTKMKKLELLDSLPSQAPFGHSSSKDFANGNLVECPYCRAVLDLNVSSAVALAYDQIQHKDKEFQDKQQTAANDVYNALLYQDDEPTTSTHSDHHHHHIPNYQKRQFRRAVSKTERFEFCQLHNIDLVIKPQGDEHNWPSVIAFDNLLKRILGFKHEIDMVIANKLSSSYRTSALKAYKNMGMHKARSTMGMMIRFETVLPGYYGTKGAAIIQEHLAAIYLHQGKLKREVVAPQTPMEYLQQVLIPEVGFRLIREDLVDGDKTKQLDPDIDDQAKRIMAESAAYGSSLHPADWNDGLSAEEEGDDDDDDDDAVIVLDDDDINGDMNNHRGHNGTKDTGSENQNIDDLYLGNDGFCDNMDDQGEYDGIKNMESGQQDSDFYFDDDDDDFYANLDAYDDYIINKDMGSGQRHSDLHLADNGFRGNMGVHGEHDENKNRSPGHQDHYPHHDDAFAGDIDNHDGYKESKDADSGAQHTDMYFDDDDEFYANLDDYAGYTGNKDVDSRVQKKQLIL